MTKKWLKYLFAILFMALLMITDKIIVNADTFNYEFYTARGYFYDTGSIYQRQDYIDQSPNVDHILTLDIHDTETINNSIYPLSFIDLTSFDSNFQTCEEDGCNIAFNIPIIEFSSYCVNDNCGLNDFIYDYRDNPTGSLCLNSYNPTCNIKATDLPDYFEYDSSFIYLYSFLTGDSNLLFRDVHGTLQYADASLDLSNVYLALYSNSTTSRVFVYTYDTNNSPQVFDGIYLKGIVYGDMFSSFYSLRLIFNYPYALNPYDFHFRMNFTNFNCNTAVNGVIPDFPERPSISLDEFLSDDEIDDTPIGSFFDNLTERFNNNAILDLFNIIINYYDTLSDSLSSTTCSSVNLGSLYGTNLVLPCFKLSDYLGNDLTTIIDYLLVFGFLFKIRHYLFKLWSDIVNLRLSKEGCDNSDV